MSRHRVEEQYPRIAFRARSRNWFARLTGSPPECQHLEHEHAWTALYTPDTLYLRGKRRAVREPERRDVSLCGACLLGELRPELAAFAGRVVAFEPDAENFSQYFFVAREDFDAAGLQAEVGAAVVERLENLSGHCEHASCSRAAKWLWLARTEVQSLDDVLAIRAASGQRFCPTHGAAALCAALEKIEQANLFYVNAPYGDAGAYVWI